MKIAVIATGLLLLGTAPLCAQSTGTPDSAQHKDNPIGLSSDFSTDAPAQDAKPADQTGNTTAASDTAGTPEIVTMPTAKFNLDTPIAALVADQQAKAVLDKDLPGLSGDENLDKFKDKSLKQFQPLTGGQLTDDLLKKVADDLAALGNGGSVTPDAPAADAPSDPTPSADDAPSTDAPSVDSPASAAAEGR